MFHCTYTMHCSSRLGPWINYFRVFAAMHFSMTSHYTQYSIHVHVMITQWWPMKSRHIPRTSTHTGSHFSNVFDLLHARDMNAAVGHRSMSALGIQWLASEWYFGISFAANCSTQHTAHSTQHTAHSTQHTAHSTQHTAHSCCTVCCACGPGNKAVQCIICAVQVVLAY